MARVRATTLVLVAALAVLLASASVARATRTEPTPAAAAAAAEAATNKASPDEKGAMEDHECEGAGDQEECMARRTLAAHTDYIYTQEHHN